MLFFKNNNDKMSKVSSKILYSQPHSVELGKILNVGQPH